MKQIIQALVVILIATPFIYMAYDVSMDLSRKFVKASAVGVSRAKPVLVSFMTGLFK